MSWDSRRGRRLRVGLPLDVLDNAGVFETIRVYGGRAAGLNGHLARLEASARTAGLRLPPRAVTEARLREALARAGHRDAIVRLSAHASGAPRAAGAVTLVCSVRPFGGCPPDWYAHGVAIVTSSVVRPGPSAQPSQVKGNDYLNALSAILSQPRPRSGGGTHGTGGAFPPDGRAPELDPLMLTSSGTVAETTVANLLLLRAGVLWTPPASCGILLGVTRGMALETAARIGLVVRVVPFTRHDVYNADEVFLTNAAVEVLPVVEADRRRIGAGRPGPWAPRLRRAYLDLALEG